MSWAQVPPRKQPPKGKASAPRAKKAKADDQKGEGMAAVVTNLAALTERVGKFQFILESVAAKEKSSVTDRNTLECLLSFRDDTLGALADLRHLIQRLHGDI